MVRGCSPVAGTVCALQNRWAAMRWRRLQCSVVIFTRPLLDATLLGKRRAMPDGQYLRNTDVTDAEWQARCELAALYHVCNYLGWTDLINTHMSVRVPGEEGTFLINRYGEMFDEVTASSLVKMDMDGNVLGVPGRFNNAGFIIHSGVYKAREDAM